jgi:hypothetical protein
MVKWKWVQLRLSTCIVLMFVSGGLLWANLIPKIDFHKDYDHVIYGWPDWIYIGNIVQGRSVHDTWLKDAIISNCVLALFFLIAAAAASEWLMNWNRATHRKWYQPHLLVRLLFLITLIGLVALNLDERRSHPNFPYDRYYGWPWTFVQIDSDVLSNSRLSILYHCRKGPLIANTAAGMALLLVLSGCAEILIRRWTHHTPIP